VIFCERIVTIRGSSCGTCADAKAPPDRHSAGLGS
jgi:hypothetical protein